MKRFLLTLILLTFAFYGNSSAFAKSSNSNYGKSVTSYIVLDDDEVLSVDYGKYLNKINSIVRKTWLPQSYRKDLKISVIALFKNDGTVKRYKVLRSSGSKSVDITALAALQVNSPFDVFPAGAEEKFIRVKFLFSRYLLNGKTANYNDNQEDYSYNFNNYQTPVPYSNSIVEPTPQFELCAYDQLLDPSQKGLLKNYLDYVTGTLKGAINVTDEDAPLSYFRFNIRPDGIAENIKLITSQDGKTFAENVAVQISNIIFRKFPPELRLKNNRLTVEYHIGTGTLEGASFTDNSFEFKPFTLDDVQGVQTQPRLREVPLFEPITNDEFHL